MTQTITTILSILTIVGDVIIVVAIISGIVALVSKKSRKTIASLYKKIGDNGIIFGFIVALIATAGSLFYSEIAGYDPCKYCWLQRIFMYPLVIIFGMAYIKGHKKVADYGIVLSIFGGVLAAIHYLFQVNILKSTSCGSVGYSAVCSDHFVLNYGYITIPMMALTAFALIIIFMIAQKKIKIT